jgi:hypothetical protein
LHHSTANSVYWRASQAVLVLLSRLKLNFRAVGFPKYLHDNQQVEENMINKHRLRKMMGKSLVALSGLVLLWYVYPVLAGIFTVVSGLCVIAYWGDNSKSLSTNKGVTLEEFRRQLGFTETISLVDQPAEEEQRETDRELVAAD